MEPFIVSARKYRPQAFVDVVGQEAITNTLTNAIENDHLAQALLFCGPRGVGKTTCARILAKQINRDGTEKEDEDFAFNIFELDAASNNSVDDIRNLIDQVRIPPQVGKYKVYIIDEVHMLSQSAFNAFLKTLEEPPRHAIFILATTEKHKIIPTILSRCQIFDFKRITVGDAANYLKYIAEQQGIKAEEDALHIIAQKADGALRDALSIFDRVVSFSGKELTRKAVTENLNVLDYDTYFEVTDLILENDIPNLLLLFNRILAQGFEGHHFVIGLASHFRDLMVCRHKETVALLEVGDNAKRLYLEQAKKTSQEFLLQALEITNETDLQYKSSKNSRLLVELTLMKLASLTFKGEKKNPEGSHNHLIPLVDLIPASYFHKTGNGTSVNPYPAETRTKEEFPAASEVRYVPQDSVPETEDEDELLEEALPEPTSTTVRESPPRIQINTPAKRVSGLSLSSIQAKKKHELNKIEVTYDEDDLPREPVSQEALRKHWNLYIQKMDDAGKKILASNLNADLPVIEENTISITLPNDTMKKEVEREQSALLNYLKSALNNHYLELSIVVNEETMRKYAFTPQEKYEKLREKNPAIDLLRKTFDLDL
ncbi:DNA polymerase-3 subunit gamma/tau [Muriicola jejuensis]|uniref:DNA polymerase III subunit gamma/tau n=1 Tax=Muriicola jejuensis TaxID=504488 RepID=A0A6P0U730_9FLAO|nr:DNA polymerase III subunit gamma/tau [Muriicola jejuensis]NER08947.1 DNA polymerase III subunit gamma/tau [Muriicola jejuensis]SMP12673.1 DNA polymerase-3 subunit gamma/tau [Muriicola jejuensis]